MNSDAETVRRRKKKKKLESISGVKMGKIKETMKQIGIRNREKTNLDNAQSLILWLIKTHPKIIDEYNKSKFFKILTRTNKYSSVMEAHHFLRTGNNK